MLHTHELTIKAEQLTRQLDEMRHRQSELSAALIYEPAGSQHFPHPIVNIVKGKQQRNFLGEDWSGYIWSDSKPKSESPDPVALFDGLIHELAELSLSLKDFDPDSVRKWIPCGMEDSTRLWITFVSGFATTRLSGHEPRTHKMCWDKNGILYQADRLESLRRSSPPQNTVVFPPNADHWLIRLDNLLQTSIDAVGYLAKVESRRRQRSVLLAAEILERIKESPMVEWWDELPSLTYQLAVLTGVQNCPIILESYDRESVAKHFPQGFPASGCAPTVRKAKILHLLDPLTESLRGTPIETTTDDGNRHRFGKNLSRVDAIQSLQRWIRGMQSGLLVKSPASGNTPVATPETADTKQTPAQRKAKRHQLIRKLANKHDITNQWARLRDICNADPEIQSLNLGSLTNDAVRKVMTNSTRKRKSSG